MKLFNNPDKQAAFERAVQKEKNVIKYHHYELTEIKADKILKTWGNDKTFYAENHHGVVYWNGKTGEILWYGDESYNAELLK